MARGGDFFSRGLPECYPQSDDTQDTLILHFFGNSAFKHGKFYLAMGNWHLLHPEILDDEDVNGLFNKTSTLVHKIQETFKGKIKILGPFPRHLEPCCNDPKHKLPMGNIPIQSTLDYFFKLNNFLAKHQKMVFTSTEFIPFYRIFGAKIPSPFTTDGVHLTPPCNKSYANFLSSISIRKPSIYPPFSQPYPSFHLYMESLSSPSSKLSSLPRHIPQTTILSFTPPTPTQRSHTDPNQMEEEVMEQDHEEIMDVTLTTETPPPDTEDLNHLLEGPGLTTSTSSWSRPSRSLWRRTNSKFSTQHKHRTLRTHLHIIHHITSTSASNTASSNSYNPLVNTVSDQQLNINLFFPNFIINLIYHIIFIISTCIVNISIRT